MYNIFGHYAFLVVKPCISFHLHPTSVREEFSGVTDHYFFIGSPWLGGGGHKVER